MGVGGADLTTWKPLRRPRKSESNRFVRFCFFCSRMHACAPVITDRQTNRQTDTHTSTHTSMHETSQKAMSTLITARCNACFKPYHCYHKNISLTWPCFIEMRVAGILCCTSKKLGLFSHRVSDQHVSHLYNGDKHSRRSFFSCPGGRYVVIRGTIVTFIIRTVTISFVFVS